MASFKAMPVYVNGKKVAELQDCDVKFMSNGEQITGHDAVLGYSTGIVTMEVSAGTAMPEAGLSVNIIQMVLKQQDVQIGVRIGPQTYKSDGRFLSANITSTSKSGVQTGKFEFSGGEPKVA
ncbi:MAG: hypothetical protein ACTHU0_01295 [Kofleriaceae bacterium]